MKSTSHKTISLEKYGMTRVAAATPRLKVGDAAFNASVISELIAEAAAKKCHIIAFPELSVSGFSCGDLFFHQSVLESVESAIFTIAEATLKAKSIVIVGAPLRSGGKLFNCGVVISRGEVLGVVPKTYLCNSKEYYEERWFSSEFDRIEEEISINGSKVPFGADLLFEAENFTQLRLGIEICEDLWAMKLPSADQAVAGATMLVNLSASNEYLGKSRYRRDQVRMHSGRCYAAYVYSASGVWESSSDTIYSGHSMIAENAKLLAENERFSFDSKIVYADVDIQMLLSERHRNNSYGISMPEKVFRIIGFTHELVDVEVLLRYISPTPFLPDNDIQIDVVCDEIVSIMAAALARRLKHLNTKTCVIGISGGLDSTLALLVAIESFRRNMMSLDGIHAISMPGPGSSPRTQNNAQKLASKLDTSTETISIEKAVEEHLKDIGHPKGRHDNVYENAQARERTQILMDMANKVHGIVIGTGDLSELALGWCTYNADQMSMYGLNAGVPKTLVKYLIRWFATKRYSGEIAAILFDILDTPISPELLPLSDKGEILQETEKGLGPYVLHDFFLYYMIRHSFSAAKTLMLAESTFANQFTREIIIKWMKVFIRRFFSQQYKRSAMPEGIKVGTVSLSPRSDWRMPGDISPENTFLSEIEVKKNDL